MVYISFALPLRADELGASALEIGGLFSVFTISLLVLRPLVGFGLDAFGRRPFFLLAMVAYSVSSFVYSSTSELDHMYLGRFLQGLAASLLLITTDTLTADLTTISDRATAMGRNMESQTRGGMTGAFVGFTLVGIMPLAAWNYSFLTYGCFALVASIFAIVSIPETRSHIERQQFKLSFEMEPGLGKVMFVVTVSAFCNAIIQPVYLIYLKERFDVSMLTLAMAFLPAGIVYATLPSKFGALSDRWGRGNTIALGLAMAGLLYIVLPTVNVFLWVAVVYTFGHMGWALVDPARHAWVGDLSNDKNRGRSYGISELFAGLGASVGPLVGGYIYEYHGKDLVFYLNGVLLLLFAVCIFYFFGNRTGPGQIGEH